MDADQIARRNMSRLTNDEIIEATKWALLTPVFEDGRENRLFCKPFYDEWCDEVSDNVSIGSVFNWYILDVRLDFQIALSRLAQNERRVICLYLAGYTESEIGSMFGGVVHSSISRKLAAIREKIELFLS